MKSKLLKVGGQKKLLVLGGGMSMGIHNNVTHQRPEIRRTMRPKMTDIISILYLTVLKISASPFSTVIWECME